MILRQDPLGHDLPDDPLFVRIADDLEQRGLTILPDALPGPLGHDLVQALQGLEASDFHRAGIGREARRDLNSFVRRDRIHWIEDQPASWLAWTERLRLFLNRRLLLGLFSFESHFAIYDPGAFYRRHLDAFRGAPNRVLSLIVYLNHGWQPDDGGELVIHDDAVSIRVTPAFGTLVLFLSDRFPHEVLTAARKRYSVAGWFRLNASIGDRLDPPE